MGIKSIALGASALVLSTSASAALVVDNIGNIMRNSCLAGIMFALTIFGPGVANGTTVNYRSDLPGYAPAGQQTIQLTTLSLGGITVTGSGILNFLEDNGLGVVGGSHDNIIDTQEFVTFEFENGLAKDISYFDPSGSPGDEILSAWGSDGIDLGSVSLGAGAAGTIDVSALFGGVGISKFTFTSDGSTARIGHIDYSTVPVPAAIWLFGSGLLGLVGMARRKA